MANTTDINSYGSADTSATSSPYGVGNYAMMGAPTNISGSGTDVSLTDPVPADLGGLATPNVPNLSNPANNAALPGAAPAASSSSSFDWSSILGGLGSILGSPAVSSAAMIGLGEYEAGQAQSQTAALTSQLSGPSQGLVQGGVTEAGQAMQGLTGAPVTGGSIGQQEQAAKNLGDIATQYSTGQLTPAQQAQVQQQVQSQQQNIRSQLQSQGITDGSVLAMYDQQIQDNAAQLTQQLITQNTALATSSLGAVQTTYSNLLNQAISQFGAGMGPIEDAVNLTVQQNTAIATGLQSLFGQIARGYSGATGTAGTGAAGSASSISNGLNGILKSIGSLFGGSSTNTGGLNLGSSGSTGILDGSIDPNTPSYDVAGQTGITPSFDTGFMSSQDSSNLTDVGGSDLSSFGSLFGPSSAGGQAAGSLSDPVPGDLGGLATNNVPDLSNPANNPALSSGLGGIGSALGTVGSVAGIVGGLTSHTATGEAGAALSAAQLANKGGLLGAPSSSLGAGLGAAGGALGLYSGIQQGGVAGGLGAASSALRLGSGAASLAGEKGLSTALGGAAGAIAIPLSLYNFAESWQSGATGSDALSGAEAGGTIGSAFGPIGTAVGAVIGGAVGALSSMFGGGKTDPESLSLKGVVSQYGQAYAQNPQAAQQALSEMSPAQSFQMLAGAFDAKNNSAGHSQPIEQAFGRMNEGEFVNQMADQINSAVQAGHISSNTPPDQVYAQVVEPWINSKTNGQGILGGDNGEGGVITGSIQNLIGAYMGGQLTSSTPIGVSGQIDTNLPMFA